MIYDKKIKYLDYCENGERVRGSGFVKCELRNGSLKMEIIVTGISSDTSVTCDVILLCGDKEIMVGRIGIAEGRGQYFYLCQDAGNIADTGIGYGELRGILIPLGESREISCSWQPQKAAVNQGAFSGGAEKRKPEQRTDKRAESEQPEVRRIVSQSGRRKPEEKERETRRESTVDWPMAEETMTEDLTVKEAEAAPEAQTAEVQLAERQQQKEKQRKQEEMRRDAEEKRPDRENHAGRDANREYSAMRSADRITSAGGSEGREERVRTGADREEGTGGSIDRREAAARQEAVKGAAVRGNGVGERAGRGRLAGEDTVIESIGEESFAGKGVDRERRVRGGAAGENRKREGKPVVQRENKWDQLWTIYPHIRPFRDKREYLSIGPSDFVLFPSASYRMVNNSFLLHGYYNHHHLILAKVEKRGETYYYIGVPGNYYEREKQVAIMFGFESFECAEEPAQAGDFGYYMMRTEL